MDFEIKGLVQEEKNTLFILYKNIMFVCDEEQWISYAVNDIIHSETNFKELIKPGFIGYKTNNNSSGFAFILSGGLISNTSLPSKAVYTIDVNEGPYGYVFQLDIKCNDMNQAKHLHNLVNINDKYILAIGGKSENDWLNDVEVLDLEKGQWSYSTPLLNKRANHESVKLGNYVYVYGGFSGKGQPCEILIERSKIVSDLTKLKWDALNLKMKDKPAFISMKLISFDENILILGGFDGTGLSKKIYEFNVDQNEIKEIGNLSNKRGNFHAFKSSDIIHVIGGSGLFEISTTNGHFTNYYEKLSFNLSNKLESELVSFDQKVNIEYPIMNIIGMNPSYLDNFNQNPGFPYHSSTTLQIN